MKITWFGGRALRIQASGQIVAFFPGSADQQFDRHEIVGGSDRVFESALADLPPFLTSGFDRPAPRRLIDEMDEEADGLSLVVARLGEADIVVEGEGETPLVILGAADGDVTEAPGDWPHHMRDGAVLIFKIDQTILGLVKRLARGGRVRLFLIAVAGLNEANWADLAKAGEGVPMQVLEPALGLEL
ncbi:MAG: hypothetical protein H6873_09965 [Hyphomicrobiaceae bacterium]|nr:hypothetical protein [Hyphomicrobiaceae bacterium]